MQKIPVSALPYEYSTAVFNLYFFFHIDTDYSAVTLLHKTIAYMYIEMN